jgi:type II secretory ATPase GspE/PulE/Tfp pilus assembly ATPase PilB-like protein
MDISERRVPQDGHIGIWHNAKEYDLRISSLPVVGGEKIVMRILDTTEGVASLEQVVRDPQDCREFDSLISNPYGMILLTGPTGSGKTTTLYSSIRQMDTRRMNISTVEDPIEYNLPGITQIQTHEKIGMTFAVALKALLRQDPDVVMLGEIRDAETATTAVQAALTGHLVLSTLHTNDAPGSITRMINIGIEPFLVGAALNGVLAQRLVRRICTKCAAERPVSAETRDLLVAFGLAIVTHSVFAVVFSAGFAAVGPWMPFADGAVVSALTSVAQIVPLSVGGMGVRELSISGLGAELVPKPAADAAAVALALTFTVFVALGGLVEVWRMVRGAR